MEETRETVAVAAVANQRQGNEDEEALDAPGLAVALKVSLSTVQQMTSRNIIPSLPVGGRLGGRRYIFSEVVAALRAHRAQLKLRKEEKRKYFPPKDGKKAGRKPGKKQTRKPAAASAAVAV